MPPRQPLLVRFLEKVQKTESCWLWTGSTKYPGYGQIAADYDGTRVKTLQAHRVSYELFVGNIPTGKVIHHICKNKSCVNPNHLMLCDSQREHMYMHGKVKCIRLDSELWLSETPKESLTKEEIHRLVQLGVSQTALAKKLGISKQRINQIIQGK
jgi:hypothetical protein